MKQDEFGNIEVESKEDFKNGIVNDYSFAYDPKQIIYTRDLKNCVGLGLIKKVKGIRKRGLIHVLYNKEFTKDDYGNISIPQHIALRTTDVLNNFINDFKNNKKSVMTFKNPKAIMVYLRPVYSKKTEGYENPMADYIKGYLKKLKIDLYSTEATTNNELPSVLNMDADPKEVYHKDFALKHDSIAIVMYNNCGAWINKKGYELLLNF